MALAREDVIDKAGSDSRGRKLFERLDEVDVSPAGIPVRVQWAALDGATDVDVSSATVTIGPAVLTETLGSLPLSTNGNQRIVTVPAGKRLRSLTLSGFKTDDDAEAVAEADLAARGRRLAVIVDSGGEVPAPQHAVPAIGRRNLMPPLLTGASLSNRVLSLPDVAGARVRLTLVSGDAPEEFTSHVMTLTGVSGVAAVLPRDLELLEPDGSTVVWAFPGEMPPGTAAQTVDLRLSVRKLAASALKARQPLDFTFTLKSSNTARIGFAASAAHGSLLRVFPGVVRAIVAGDPLPLPIDAAPPLGAAPAGATADLTVTYDGLRLSRDLSDDLPSAATAVSGPIVRDDGATRVFPPAAFDRIAPARIGVVGRAPESCELSLQLVERVGDATGRTIVPPAVIRVEPSPEIATHWFELPEMAPPARPTAVMVRATSGRFFWAAGEQPLIRVAVRDPDPDPMPLLFGGAVVATVDAAGVHQPGRTLPPGSFAGAPPVVSSDLFVTVDVSDLTLRYAR
jgi:hypothetical protein